MTPATTQSAMWLQEQQRIGLNRGITVFTKFLMPIYMFVHVFTYTSVTQYIIKVAQSHNCNYLELKVHVDLEF